LFGVLRMMAFVLSESAARIAPVSSWKSSVDSATTGTPPTFRM
jgi:hypothetical protein